MYVRLVDNRLSDGRCMCVIFQVGCPGACPVITLVSDDLNCLIIPLQHLHLSPGTSWLGNLDRTRMIIIGNGVGKLVVRYVCGR